MDNVEELNFYEEFERIFHSLVEVYQRLREGDDRLFIMHWLATYLPRNKRNVSIVRWIADHLPSCSFEIDTQAVFNYEALWRSVFTERSLVREIGSRLPIQPSKRPYFYMLHQIDMQHTKFKATSGVQPRLIHSTPCKKSISPSMSMWETNNESCLESVLEQSTATIVTGDAVRKISALEDELNRLRAQIAGFVLKQEEPASNTVLPPRNATAGPIPAPPPPPPLPSTQQHSNLLQTPKKDDEKQGNGTVRDGSGVLNMAAILKDLNQVKLKAVERSPGGTPIRRAPLKTKGTDPASIIADALKTKFAKSRIAAASPDKENVNCNSRENSFSNTPSPQKQFRKPPNCKPKPPPRNRPAVTLGPEGMTPLRV